MAASVVNNILSEPYVFADWPNYPDNSGDDGKGMVMKE